MKKIYIIVVLITGFAILSYSCKRHLVSIIFDTTKEYCKFGKNNYWIYQDSDSNAIDSVVLKSVSNEVRENSDYNVQEEIILLQFEHYLKNTSFVTNSKIESSYKGVQTTYNYYSGDIATFDTINFASIYSRYFSLQKITNSVELINGSLYSELVVNNIVHEDVIVYETSAAGNALVVYWAKDIGIIRYEIKNKTVNLIRYSVF